jgi:transposase-like protein
MGIRQRRRKVLAAGAHGMQNRGVQDIFIACIDGLKGFPEATNWDATHPTISQVWRRNWDRSSQCSPFQQRFAK